MAAGHSSTLLEVMEHFLSKDVGLPVHAGEGNDGMLIVRAADMKRLFWRITRK